MGEYLLPLYIASGKWPLKCHIPALEMRTHYLAVVVDLTIGPESPGLMPIVLCPHFFVVLESFC